MNAKRYRGNFSIYSALTLIALSVGNFGCFGASTPAASLAAASGTSGDTKMQTLAQMLSNQITVSNCITVGPIVDDGSVDGKLSVAFNSAEDHFTIGVTAYATTDLSCGGEPTADKLALVKDIAVTVTINSDTEVVVGFLSKQITIDLSGTTITFHSKALLGSDMTLSTVDSGYSDWIAKLLPSALTLKDDSGFTAPNDVGSPIASGTNLGTISYYAPSGQAVGFDAYSDGPAGNGACSGTRYNNLLSGTPTDQGNVAGRSVLGQITFSDVTVTNNTMDTLTAYFQISVNPAGGWQYLCIGPYTIAAPQ